MPEETKEPENEVDYLDEANDILTKIEDHLRSIKNMLTFFLVLAILDIILQACSVLHL
ncbi:MAG TPA: hypothetical protein VIN60_06395 [Anaerolineales bacterium]